MPPTWSYFRRWTGTLNSPPPQPSGGDPILLVATYTMSLIDWKSQQDSSLLTVSITLFLHVRGKDHSYGDYQI